MLAETEQMRREADNVGPKAELEHWKKRMAKFNSLLLEIKSQKCKALIGVLIAAKSKLLKVSCFCDLLTPFALVAILRKNLSQIFAFA